MSSLAAGEMDSQVGPKTRGSVWMALKMPFSSAAEPPKGTCPDRRMKRMTPSAKASTCMPYRLWKTSGAM